MAVRKSTIYGPRYHELMDISSTRRLTSVELEELYGIKFDLLYSSKEKAKEKLKAKMKALSETEKLEQRLLFLENTGQGASAEAVDVRAKLGITDKAAREEGINLPVNLQATIDRFKRPGSKMPLIIGGAVAVAIVIALMARRKKS